MESGNLLNPFSGAKPILRDYDKVAIFAAELQHQSPTAVLEWALGRYAPRLAVVSNFGPGTVVVLHHVAELDSTVPVLHLNTGFEFAETEEVGRRLEERYGLRIVEVHPEQTIEQQAQTHGPELYKSDPDFCCYLRKVVPLENALAGYDAWVTGIRKTQSNTRQNAQVVEWDNRHDMVKINPLAEWTKERVWDFIREHRIPYNALHDQGYPSVGCWPCTRPVAEGEDERAGRWSGLDKTECGIHLAHTAQSRTDR
jgi:phosphoadenosine phosphosulfate reductase